MQFVKKHLFISDHSPKKIEIVADRRKGFLKATLKRKKWQSTGMCRLLTEIVIFLALWLFRAYIISDPTCAIFSLIDLSIEINGHSV